LKPTTVLRLPSPPLRGYCTSCPTVRGRN